MSASPAATLDERAGFRHEALLYAGEEDFVRQTAAFLRDGGDAGEPALVVVSAAKICLLREELGGDGGHVQFADMGEVGANPARIIPAWRAFLEHRGGAGRRVRGVGEPAWPGRTPAELAECRRHESLLNLAFVDGPPWWLVCPYDTDGLEPSVVAEARRTHPLVREGGVSRESASYEGLEAAAVPLAEPLPEPLSAEELTFDAGGLERVRDFVAGRAEAAALDRARAAQLVVAANELAANSIRHGGGGGSVRIWADPDAVLCEVRDGGSLDLPLAGRIPPSPAVEGGRGLWLVNQLCDLVQVRAVPGGTVVRLHMRYGTA